MPKHIYYQTGEIDAPDAIKDSNGEVCLALCRVCWAYEGGLPTACPGRPLSYIETDLIHKGLLDFIEGEDYAN